METLNLPKYDFKLRSEGQRTEIFDPFRKRYVALTPEEWVRQNVLQYLVQEKGFAIGLMSVEHSLKLNGMQKRADAVVFDQQGKPIMVVECKAASVKISQDTFDQIARYNLNLQVPYLFVSNGLEHFCCRIDIGKKTYSYLEKIPDFAQLISN